MCSGTWGDGLSILVPSRAPPATVPPVVPNPAVQITDSRGFGDVSREQFAGKENKVKKSSVGRKVLPRGFRWGVARLFWTLYLRTEVERFAALHDHWMSEW